MKVLVVGGNGMLGHKLIQSWNERFEVWATLKGHLADYEKYGIFDKKRTLDLVDAEKPETVEKAIAEIRPQVIFNAVGIIKQLPTSKNVIKTVTINSIFPHRLAEMAGKSGARLINISTDCVFDGEKGHYTEEDISNATDVYGKSKNLGEVTGENCLTLRTSIIGRELQTSHSLVEWFLSNRGKKVKGFVNAIYSGFPTIVLADIIADLIENHQSLSGLYHVSAEPINKFELLKLINEAYQTDIEIEAFADFRIDRSLDSTKFRNETGFYPLSWDEMIEKMADDPTPYDEWRK
ncbi:MAG TPA: SDR family oxidoreductase [Pyrinomonadaceae bacterium]|nr:SDR family oxidoreductase [Pyrinomonadaceae bacterium]